MDRRSFLGLATAFIIKPSFGATVPTVKNFGWMPVKNKRTPNLYKVSNLKDYGKGKVVCLWKAWETVTGRKWTPYSQLVGDCVGQGAGSCIDILDAIQIVTNKRRDRHIAPSSRMAIYAGGRQLAIPDDNKRSRFGDGMQGIWAVNHLIERGNLLKKNYAPYDLSQYTLENINYLDKNGLPPSLITIAKEHPLGAYSEITCFNELRDAIASLHTVLLCATFGFENSTRDKDGFGKVDSTWYHAWCVAGVRDDHRPGALLINSHGLQFGKGPKAYNQPDGSIWVDAEEIDKHIAFRQRGRVFYDSYALSNYKGFSVPEYDYKLW